MKRKYLKLGNVLILTMSLTLSFLMKGNVYAINQIVSETHNVTGSETIGSAKRSDDFYGDMYVVKNGGTLIVTGTIDGNRLHVTKGSESLIKVEAGGKLIVDRGTLKNNADTAIVSHGGSIEIKGGTLSNNGSLSKVTASLNNSARVYKLQENCDMLVYGLEENYYTRQHPEIAGKTSDQVVQEYLEIWAKAVDDAYSAYENNDWQTYLIKQEETQKMFEYLQILSGCKSVATNHLLYGWSSGSPFGKSSCDECKSDFADMKLFKTILSNKTGAYNRYESYPLYEIKVNNDYNHLTCVQEKNIEYSSSQAAYGGAIYADGASQITIDNSTIGGTKEISDSNNAELNIFENANIAAFGGGIYIKGSSQLTIRNSTMKYNDTYHGKPGQNIFKPGYTANVLSNAGHGGAIYVSGPSTVNIDDSTILSDNRSHSGGAIYADTEANIIINKASIKNNHATFGNGGAILARGSAIVLNGASIINNHADWPEIGTSSQANGGAIALMRGSKLTINSGMIQGNVAVNNGGGIALMENTALTRSTDSQISLTMNGGTIMNNTAVAAGHEHGTELYIGSGNKTIKLSGGSIINNDIDMNISDNAALYIDNPISTTTTDNFIKLDGVQLDGVCYLTKANKVLLTATEQCRDDFKLRLNLSNDFIPGTKVVDGPKAFALLKNAYITNPDGRELAIDDQNDLYILKIVDYSQQPGVEIQGLKKADGKNYVYGETYNPILVGVLDTDSVKYSYAPYDGKAPVNYNQYVYSNDKPMLPGQYIVKTHIEKTITTDGHTYKTAGYVYQIYTIDKKDIEITIDNQISEEGYPLEELSMRITNGTLISGDALDDLKIQLSKAEGTSVGQYEITGKSTSRKYQVKFINGKYTIKENTKKVSFLEKYQDILKETKDTIMLDQKNMLSDALSTYKNLDSITQRLLQNEYKHLNGLKVEIENIQTQIYEFKNNHKKILNTDIKDIQLSSLKDVNQALNDYKKLSKKLQTQLFSEYQKLIIMYNRIDVIQKEVNYFKNTYQLLLSKDIHKTTKDDLAMIDKAINDYNQLSIQAKKELSKEFQLLVEMRNKIIQNDIVIKTEDMTSIFMFNGLLLISLSGIYIFKKKCE